MAKKKWTLESIEKFILESGSDDLPTFNGEYEGGCHCQQIYDEMSPFILSLLESGEEIKNYLEVGVAAGGTTFILDHFFNFKKAVLVDDNKHHKAQLRRGILKDVKTVEMIGRSTEKRILEAAETIGPYDLIVIDGDHSLDAVEKDAVHYLPMVRKNGFIAFHDSIIEEWGVHIVVQQLMSEPIVEFVGEYVTKTKTRACGMALFQKKV